MSHITIIYEDDNKNTKSFQQGKGSYSRKELLEMLKEYEQDMIA